MLVIYNDLKKTPVPIQLVIKALNKPKARLGQTANSKFVLFTKKQRRDPGTCSHHDLSMMLCAFVTHEYHELCYFVAFKMSIF
jgi:hypothetical protein